MQSIRIILQLKKPLGERALRGSWSLGKWAECPLIPDNRRQWSAAQINEPNVLLSLALTLTSCSSLSTSSYGTLADERGCMGLSPDTIIHRLSVLRENLKYPRLAPNSKYPRMTLNIGFSHLWLPGALYHLGVDAEVGLELRLSRHSTKRAYTTRSPATTILWAWLRLYV